MYGYGLEQGFIDIFVSLMRGDGMKHQTMRTIKAIGDFLGLIGIFVLMYLYFIFIIAAFG